jgi:2-polyprenyl-3-methyl-5-hydroxy-6-metoxy-1,4-benzoquinol methylase
MSKTHEKHRLKGKAFINDQRNFFDNLITNDWNTYINDQWDEERQHEIDEILKRIPMPETVLDIGCGCGYHDMIFAENHGVNRIIGIDYSVKSIDTANRKYHHPRVKRFVADIYQDREKILKEGPFDLVCSFQVIEHVTKVAEFMDNCKSLVKFGGHIAIVTPNFNNLQNSILKLLRRPIIYVDPLHFREYGVNALKHLGADVGLGYIDHFGRGLHLNIGKYTFLKFNSIIERPLNKLFPRMSDVIGVIFKRIKK